MSGSGGGGGGKINPKNLHYDRSATLPPFLARLHAQHAPGNFDGPDPILAARRRPTKKRSGSEEAEDAPLILDEEGNVVDGVMVGKDGTVKEKEREVEGISDRKEGGEEGNEADKKVEGGGGGGGGGGDAKEEEKEQDKNVGIGASKKRKKVGKVIGGGGSDADSDQEQGEDGKALKGKTEASSAKDSGKTEEAEEKPKPKATKKKAKKIKLSFGDEDG
ncbi:hypothetical protein N0V85_003052 [Neurospora sp. IMI 360204]|nr:hypothetical protein N0V85_003052 [Neurospora sp. IMI 360204]